MGVSCAINPGKSHTSNPPTAFHTLANILAFTDLVSGVKFIIPAPRWERSNRAEGSKRRQRAALTAPYSAEYSSHALTPLPNATLLGLHLHTALQALQARPQLLPRLAPQALPPHVTPAPAPTHPSNPSSHEACND